MKCNAKRMKEKQPQCARGSLYIYNTLRNSLTCDKCHLGKDEHKRLWLIQNYGKSCCFQSNLQLIKLCLCHLSMMSCVHSLRSNPVEELQRILLFPKIPSCILFFIHHLLIFHPPNCISLTKHSITCLPHLPTYQTILFA